MEHVPVISYATQGHPPFWRYTIRAIELMSGQPRLNALYRQYRRERQPSDNIWRECVSRLKLDLKIEGPGAQLIPTSGPLAVIANHPFGILDGLALFYMISEVRGDIKLIAHSAFGVVPELKPYLLPIDFSGSREAIKVNVRTRRIAVNHIVNGGAVIIFPSGYVSSARHLTDTAVEPEWKLFCASLIRRARADVLPVYFKGQNSWLFHAASRLGTKWRECLLIHETVRRIGTSLTARVGNVVPWDTLAQYPDKQQLMDALRLAVYDLATVEDPTPPLKETDQPDAQPAR